MPLKLPSVGIVSLGCPKNLVDTEVMLGYLKREGLELGDPDTSRVVIVNTCGFIDQAKEESVNAVLEQVRRKEAGEVDRVVVAGCMVQKYGAELAAEIPEVDHFLGLDELEKAPAAALGLPSLARFAAKPLATRLYDDLAPRVLTGRRGYAYLKVAEGCNNPCTFCTIPQMRGLQRSRSIESLVREAQGLEAQGVSELVLISQDTTRYGEDLGLGREGLATLVATLLRETGFPWVRFLYAYPKTLHDSVLERMAAEPRFVSYVDVLLGRKPVGERVAIVGAGGIGFDVATFLVEGAEGHGRDLERWKAEWGVADPETARGGLVKPRPAKAARRVTLLQRKATRPGAGLAKTTGWIHRAALKAKGVEMLAGVRYDRVDDAGLTITRGTKEPETRLLEVDTVVLCAGQEPLRELETPLREAGVSVHLIGGADVAAELDAKRAIEQGTLLAGRL